jgi:hypothetical protein
VYVLFVYQELSESESDSESVKSAVNRFAETEDLIGDGSQQFCLPTIPGKHQDLTSISADTVSKSYSRFKDSEK